MSQSKQLPAVFKIGGALVDNQTSLDALFIQIAQLTTLGRPAIIVHGGGCFVDQQLGAQGFKTQKHEGQRITPVEQMPIIAGVLSGYVNKSLVATAQKHGLKAIGLSLIDGQMTTTTDVDQLGCVAETSPADPSLLISLLSRGYIPVISSIAATADGKLRNVNADIAARTVAELIQGELILLTDTAGVLDAEKNTIPHLDHTLASQLVADGVIQQGMKVKIDAALAAAKTLRRSIAVVDWRQLERLTNQFPSIAANTRVTC